MRPGSTSEMRRPQEVTITPYRDGPLLVRGAIELLDPDGSPIPCNRDPIALCRCGRSQIKPFCDGTHKLIGFRAAPEESTAPARRG
jgi:CDGSH-type Zn-finger protein